MSQTEIVLYPPAVKTTIDQTKDGWAIGLCVDTKSGPMRGQIILPHETVDSIMHNSTFCTFMKHAAAKVCAANPQQAMMNVGATDDAGLFGIHFKIPNPIHMITSAAHTLVDKSHEALNAATHLIPASVREPFLHVANGLLKATGAAEVAHLAGEAAKILGSAKIPGLNIPILALTPIGAEAMIASEILGDHDAIKSISNQAGSFLSSLGDDSYDRMAGILVGATAMSHAKSVMTDAEFAKKIGIPTFKVDTQLADAAEALAHLLRQAYIHDHTALTKIEHLKQKAMTGDKEARMLWYLASEISDSAWKQHRAHQALAKMRKPSNVRAAGTMLVGDGVGDGYGQANYVPPALPLYAV